MKNKIKKFRDEHPLTLEVAVGVVTMGSVVALSSIVSSWVTAQMIRDNNFNSPLYVWTEPGDIARIDNVKPDLETTTPEA